MGGPSGSFQPSVWGGRASLHFLVFPLPQCGTVLLSQGVLQPTEAGSWEQKTQSAPHSLCRGGWVPVSAPRRLRPLGIWVLPGQWPLAVRAWWQGAASLAGARSPQQGPSHPPGEEIKAQSLQPPQGRGGYGGLSGLGPRSLARARSFVAARERDLKPRNTRKVVWWWLASQ